MHARLNLLGAFTIGIIGGALISSCQTYDFEPVEPLALGQTTIVSVIKAKASKPNLMVLLDTSGSMMLPVDSSLAGCKETDGTICGNKDHYCDVTKCPTRWSEMRGAMSSFLRTSGTVARMGFATYPAADGHRETQCFASTSVQISIPQVDDTDTPGLQAAADQIAQQIQNRPIGNGQAGVPTGGTPTAESLKFVGAQADLQTDDRDDFVLLVTDGLPNCNATNPNYPTNPQACCGLATCPADPNICLDKDASVLAVTDLRETKKIRTIVIGFGAETSAGGGPEVLNAMAEAGGFARSCDAAHLDACGAGDTCDPAKKLCGRRFYQAANQTELAAALREIINKLPEQNPCLIPLQESQLPTHSGQEDLYNLIVVYINDQPVAHDDTTTWKLVDEGVLFVGGTCDRILSSTDTNPIKLEVRAVQRK